MCGKELKSRFIEKRSNVCVFLGRQSTSPKPRTNIAHRGTTKRPDGKPTSSLSQAGSQPSGSQPILSAILRAPHTGLSKESQITGVPVPMATQHVIRAKGHSPIRVITNVADAKELTMTQGQGGHSPARTPVTLPPKKSISPSRTVVIDRRTPSPKSRESPHRNISPASSIAQGQGQSRTVQGSLMSHLPYLAQTLHQAQTIQPNVTSHDIIFQQYKTQQEQKPVGQNFPKGPMVTGRDKVTSVVLPRQPKAAHQTYQRTVSPSHQVSTIRRTPSPAHMPIKVDLANAAPEVKDTGNQSKAVDLVKIADNLRKLEVRKIVFYHIYTLVFSVKESSLMFFFYVLEISKQIVPYFFEHSLCKK